MKSEDVSAAAALERAVFSEPWSEQGFADALAERETIFLAAADDKERLIGYCGMYTAADEGEITNVAVAPEWRKKGVGSAMMEAALFQAGQRGIRAVYLEVRVSNAAAQALYRKFGFEICGIRKGFYQKPEEDALVMCWTSD